MNRRDDAMLPHAVLRGDRAHSVARATLAVTLYLANGHGWASGGASAALEHWLRRATPKHCARASHEGWIDADAETLAHVRATLPLPFLRRQGRHLYGVHLVDRRDAPAASFRYVELDESRAPSAGYLRCALPATHDFEDFAAMVRELLACGLVWSAAAGFTASVCPCHPKAGEDALRRLCRRYVGLDVQRPERSMWHAGDGLSSVSWMNVVGKPLLAKKPLILTDGDDLRAELLDAGMLVTAGPWPQLGDLNRMEFPHAYGRVASMLAGHARPRSPDEPWGDDAALWAQRFTDPEVWL